MLKQCFYRFRAFVICSKLKVTKADMALGNAHQCCSCFNGFSANRIPGTDHKQGAGGRNAQPVHGLAAQVFANSGAQNRPAIPEAGVGCHAGAFEVPVPTAAIGAYRFP